MNRDFKGVWIPKEIWLDKRLNALDKIILIEIDSLDFGEGCFASNQYLAEFCQCSENKISRSVSLLVELGYLEIIKFDGRKRFIKSCLFKMKRLSNKNEKAALTKLKDNNIDNNIDNNSISKDIEKTSEKYGDPEINELFEEWEKCCKFRIDTKVKQNRYACQRLIKSRGFERVKNVIPYVAESQLDQYAPSINNFMDLADKWNNLAIWYKKKKMTNTLKYGIIKV